jgi:hypothetical protein
MDLHQQDIFCRQNNLKATVYCHKRHFEKFKQSSKIAHQFVHHKDTTMASYQKALDNEGNDNNFAYCSILRSDPWEQLIKGPFDKDKMKAYLHHTVLE